MSLQIGFLSSWQFEILFICGVFTVMPIIAVSELIPESEFPAILHHYRVQHKIYNKHQQLI